MNKAFQTPLETVNLDALQLWIDTGRLDTTRCVVTMASISRFEHGATYELYEPWPTHNTSRTRPICRKVTIKALVDCGLVSSCRFGVKLLARGSSRLTHKVDIEVSAASAGAIEAVEAAGGRIKTGTSALWACMFACPMITTRCARGSPVDGRAIDNSRASTLPRIPSTPPYSFLYASGSPRNVGAAQVRPANQGAPAAARQGP